MNEGVVKYSNSMNNNSMSSRSIIDYIKGYHNIDELLVNELSNSDLYNNDELKSAFLNGVEYGKLVNLGVVYEWLSNNIVNYFNDSGFLQVDKLLNELLIVSGCQRKD